MFVSQRYGLIIFAVSVLTAKPLFPQQQPNYNRAQRPQIRRDLERISVRHDSWWATAEVDAGAGPFQPAPPSHRSQMVSSRPPLVNKLPTVSANSSTDNSASSLVLSTFPGPFTGNPADSGIAAGPDYLLATVNGHMVVYDKTGRQLSDTYSDRFFSAGTGCCFDPRVIYDQTHGRFMLITAQTRNDIQQGYVWLAVSATSNPLGDWYKYPLSYNDGTWPDIPTIAASATSVYITSDQVPFAQGKADWRLMVIGIQELLTGDGSLNITRMSNINSMVRTGMGGFEAALAYGTSSYQYFLSVATPSQSGDDNSHLHLFWIPVNGTPVLQVADIPVPSYADALYGDEPGGNTVNSGGDGVMSEVWRNGSLWVTQTVKGTNGAPAVRWYQIDTASHSVVQVGEIPGPGEAYYGAITVLADGSTLLVYDSSSRTQPVSGGYAARVSSDPAGAMPISGIYQPGSGSIGSVRWGDFSGISPDPDVSGAWGMVEYVNDSFPATAIVHLASPASQVNSGIAVTISPASATLTVGGTQQFTANVQNASDTSVTWSVDGIIGGDANVGTTSAMGLYTAPSIAGTHTVSVTSNADLRKSASASVTVSSGTASPLAVSPTSLNFGPQPLNSVTAVQSVSLTAGSTALSIQAISITGDFAQTNNCGQQLAARSACTIEVTFQPKRTGIRYGALSITDSDPSSPQSVSLTGSGADFGLSASPTTATISHGQSASFQIMVTPSGQFNSAVNFSCSGIPQSATCVFAPGALVPGAAPAVAILTFSVPAATYATNRVPWIAAALATGMLAFTLLPFGFKSTAIGKRADVRKTFVLSLVLLGISFVVVGCRGIIGSNSLEPGGRSPSGESGTTAGSGPTAGSTYTVTVTAGSSQIAHSLPLTITIK